MEFTCVKSVGIMESLFQTDTATPTLFSRKLIHSPATAENPMALSKARAPGNRLLALLPERTRHQLIANSDLIHLGFADVLNESGTKLRYVYFPLDSFVSLITTLDDGHKLEVGMVGDEGMVGLSLIFGVNTSPQHTLVQGSGTALRISAAAFLDQYAQNSALQQLLHRYTYVLMAQLAQTAACTHYHRLDARLARWLLSTRDRAHSDAFRLTQQFLAYMLGVRRVGVSEAASALHRRGLIDYRRGNISIQDGPALERISCGCYRRDKVTYERTMRIGSKRSESFDA
jgi:CRP-like cAMP-binding protein